MEVKQRREYSPRREKDPAVYCIFDNIDAKSVSMQYGTFKAQVKHNRKERELFSPADGVDAQEV